MSAPDIAERLRLDGLNAFRILDTPPESIFERLTRFAAEFCQTPIAAITLIDENRQWFKCRIGLDVTETDRSIAFCDHTIRGNEPFIVEDSQRHPGFSSNPLVTGPPGLRFYAGVPLLTPTGLAIGALAVMDREPRQLDSLQIDVLKMLAEQVMTHMELRRQHLELDRLMAEQERLNAELQRQARHLSEAQRIARLGSWEMQLPERCLTCSEENCRILGIAEHGQTQSFSSFMEVVHAEDRARLEPALEDCLATGSTLDLVHRIVRPDGEVRYVHQRAELLTGKDHQPVLAGTMQDITEQRQSHEKLELLNTCIARVDDIVMITSAQPLDEPGPRIVFVNSAFEKQTGYAVGETLGKSPRFLQGPDTQRAELDRIRNALQRREHVLAELVNYRQNGEPFWIEIDISPVALGSADVTHFIAIQRDITARKAAERQIEELAFFDPLTHLPNRRLLMDRLRHAIDNIERRHQAIALLFIDLDDFKNLNDTLGHDKGDLLLEQVAARLKACTRKNNTVARLGGDEFVVLLEDLSENLDRAARQAKTVAHKILACFSQAYYVDSYEYRCTPSVGIALSNRAENDVEDMLKRADLAMYRAKACGGNTFRFFDPEMQAAINARMALEREFRNGLIAQEFVMHYQPQINEHGQLVGVEALVRWKHPDHGMVRPNDFIPMAEESGLIIPLGQWVLQAACTQLVRWESCSDAPPAVAINVSARELRHPEFVRQTLAILEKTGADPKKIKLELTESALVDQIGEAKDKMVELKRHGISFSLDDFGIGYSSFFYLKTLPIDQLKIDQSFVRDILCDANAAAIVKAIVTLGKTLHLEVIAEGVETEDQRRLLAEAGCHMYQGYLISPPVPTELLRTEYRLQ